MSPRYSKFVNLIYKSVEGCRICTRVSSTTEQGKLENIIDFGEMALTGVFLEDGSTVARAPMQLCRCVDCGLVQLKHSYALDSLYGEWYGYESHLNSSMVMHLQTKARILEELWGQDSGDIYVDIASNDGTLLSGYRNTSSTLIGIDPLIEVVSDHYPKQAKKIVDYFSAALYWKTNVKPAQIVSSLSVLYDLESPIDFAIQVSEILAVGGVWHFEQSYLPSMVATNSYDTVCHEHLLYLNLHDITRILELANLQLVDVTLNDINGGSIAVTAIKSDQIIPQPPFAKYLLKKEISEGYVSGKRLQEFATAIQLHSKELQDLISNLLTQGYKIVGLGASTKGNVLLQKLSLSRSDMSCIGDINPRKFGRQTPGTAIPIVDETLVIAESNHQTVALVLPWHFRTGMINKAGGILSSGGKLLFPLPRIEMYG
jgi:hypothetical protein